MIEYIFPNNPDDRILNKASQILKNGGLICLPLESHWAVLASPFSKTAVDKLYKIRHVENTKHFTALCHDFKLAQEIAFISDSSFKVIKKLIPGPYTFILKAQKIMIKHLKASKMDHEVGIRFPHFHYFKKLMQIHQEVVICTHLSQDMFPEHNDEEPIYSLLIEETFGSMIDLIIDPGEFDFIESTTILDLSLEGPPLLIRRGSGEIIY